MISDPSLVDLDHPPSSPIARSFFLEEAEKSQMCKRICTLSDGAVIEVRHTKFQAAS
jgi:hypothetical protein